MLYLIELRRKVSGFAGHEATFIDKTEDLRAKVVALEAQLAAEASAVETLGKVEQLSVIGHDDNPAMLPEIVISRAGKNMVNAVYLYDYDPCFDGLEKKLVRKGEGATLLAALAALVQAEGKEDGK